MAVVRHRVTRCVTRVTHESIFRTSLHFDSSGANFVGTEGEWWSPVGVGKIRS